MIPLKVTLKGFLSYREEQVLDFSDAPLWVLAGRNGHGKSAVFDAITFALYKEHRGGAQNASDLINQDENELLVTFEFQIGRDIYRVKRTQGRTVTKSSRQAIHVSGPNRPNPDREGEQAIPDTDNEKGFGEWVQRTIGLNYDAFTSSFLLLQGKADTLLYARPQLKQDMLKQLVKMGDYERLHDRASEKSKDINRQSQDFQRQLERMPLYTSDELIDAEQAAKLAQQDEDEATQVLVKLEGLKVRARQWQELESELNDSQRKMTEAVNLLADETTIRIEDTRYKSLSIALPVLVKILSEQKRLENCTASIRNQQTDKDTQSQKVEELNDQLTGATAEVASFEKQLEAARLKKELAVTKRLNLATNLNDIKNWDVVIQDFGKLSEELGKFPTDLLQQIEAQTRLVAKHDQARLSLNPLEQYHTAQMKWQEANRQIDRKQAELHAISGELEDKQEQLSKSISAQAETFKAWELAKEEFTAAVTEERASKDRLGRFNQIDKKPSCDYCGLPLTAAHLETERSIVELEFSKAKLKSGQTEERRRILEAEHQLAERTVTELDSLIKNLQAKQQRAEIELKQSLHDLQEAQKTGSQQLGKLTGNYRAQFPAEPDIIACFAMPYPESTELQQIKHQAEAYNTENEKLAALNNKEGQRQNIVSRQEELQQKLDSYTVQFPGNSRQEILEEEQIAREQEAESNTEIKKLEPQLKLLREGTENSKKSLDRANEALGKAKNAIQNEITRQTEITKNLSDFRSSLAEDWQIFIPNLDEGQIRQWQDEKNRLAGAPERDRLLNEARYKIEPLKQQLEDTRAKHASFTTEERLTTPELESRELEGKHKHAKAQESRKKAEITLHEMKANQEHRQKLETQTKEATYQSSLYKKLAVLLGPDNLQNYLLEQAEKGIVANANQILDSLSSGVLKLERIGRSLNLQAHIRDGDRIKKINVAYLSGSQKFRVAVSLALGMGRYASQNGHSGESVIIDEGFGSLDKEGRQEMIDVLHDLKDVLCRIILVSHQEEFFDAFEQRYEIYLENGYSKAERKYL